MDIRFFCTHWGNQLPFPAFCRKAAKAGYEGVEMDLPLQADRRKEITACLSDHGLLLIGQYWQSLESDPRANLRNYRIHLENLAAAEPVMINAQTGKDHFTLRQNLAHLKAAERASGETGIPILHETHRGKLLFSLQKFGEALREMPDMRITLDASHWCVVHESLLEDQPAAMNAAIRATSHIHARIGFPEGPQVNDPRAPEWKEPLEAHLLWWDKVVDLHRRKNKDLSFTPEFGPEPYMPSAPYSKRPLASQWQVNLHMMKMLRERYNTTG